MRHEHQITINDLRHRLGHVQQQEENLRQQRQALDKQIREVEERFAAVQHEAHRLSYAIKAIEGIVLPSKPLEEYDQHDKH